MLRSVVSQSRVFISDHMMFYCFVPLKLNSFADLSIYRFRSIAWANIIIQNSHIRLTLAHLKSRFYSQGRRQSTPVSFNHFVCISLALAFRISHISCAPATSSTTVEHTLHNVAHCRFPVSTHQQNVDKIARRGIHEQVVWPNAFALQQYSKQQKNTERRENSP